MPTRPPIDDEPEAPEPTARPTERATRELTDAAADRLVPQENVGGAAPTTLGLDSGGDAPGSRDDLASLPEPEPPEPPEVGAVHVRRGEGGG